MLCPNSLNWVCSLYDKLQHIKTLFTSMLTEKSNVRFRNTGVNQNLSKKEKNS